MTPLPKHPRLYEINTRVWLREQRLKSPADVPDKILDFWASKFDGVWFMGVWMPSVKGRQLAQSHAGLAAELRAFLPDLTPEDIVSSPYAVREYKVSPVLGGDAALATLRRRMHDRGLRLMLDLVPNHVARDHPWVSAHPEWFVQGTKSDLDREPQNYFKTKTKAGMSVLAHGKDPYFDGWSDTVQINIFSPAMRASMKDLLMKLAGVCDGVRCDMAMLLLNRIFKRTWQNRVGDPPATEFWQEAISQVKSRHPEFIFLAEVYWDLEWELQKLGFDYTYDKKLYDLLRHDDPDPIRAHLGATPEFQAKSARMIENHDELRSAAVFEGPKAVAAAALTYAVPGMRFFHEGQFEARRAKVPVQLQRRKKETPDPHIAGFYEKLLSALAQDVMKNGSCQMLDSLQAWPGNFSHRRIFAFYWQAGAQSRLAVINFAADPSQPHVQLPVAPGIGPDLRCRDLLSDRFYDRNSEEVRSRGLYLAMPGFDAHLFQLESVQSS